MSKHTPGPWTYVAKLSASENHKGYFVRAEKATRNGLWALADVQPGDEDGKLGEANARLIAAAPELLAACEAAARIFDGGPIRVSREYVSDLQLIREAIAKARGEL